MQHRAESPAAALRAALILAAAATCSCGAKAETVQPPELAAYGEALSKLKMTVVSFHGSYAGTVLATFRFDNPTDYAVKDVEVICAPKGESGTAIGRIRRTVFQRIPAHGKKNTGAIDIGWVPTQTKAITCNINNLTLDK